MTDTTADRPLHPATDPATSSTLGMHLAHRMMRTDLIRLTTTAEEIAEGRTECSDRRARAIARWIRLLGVEIHHHHSVEDDVAWPVIAACAGAQVDLDVLTDDHEALDPMLDALQAAAGATAAARAGRDRRTAACALAAALTELRDHLVEHLAAEETAVFPVIERYVPPAEWAKVEKAASRGGAGLGYMLPRALDVLSETEEAELFGGVPAAQRVLFSLLARAVVPRHRRRERLVFGH